jgi:putative hemolysin
MGSEPPQVLLIVFGVSLVAAYVFFAAAAVVITRSRTKRLDELVEGNRFGAASAASIAHNADRYLLVTQFGSFLSVLLLGGVGLQFWREEVFTDGLALSGLLEVLLKGGIVAAALVLTLGVAQIAKAFAFAHPESILCALALPIRAWSTFSRPVAFLLMGGLTKVLRFLKVDAPAEREFGVSADEISEMVELSSEAGEIEEDEREMIQSVITLSDTVVREVMTPRTDIVAVTREMSLEEVVGVFVKEGLSRLLVIGDELDDVQGVLIAKDLMPLVGKSDPKFDFSRLVRPVFFVLNNKKVDELLAEFKREAVHFAVVLDEHGGVDGLVTVEDLLEEIVGDIFDEHDVPADELDVVRTKSGDLLVVGSALIEELNQSHGFGFPTGEYDTIAGFVIHHLGRIPSVGEIIEVDGVRIRVEEIAHNRVVRLRVMFRKASKQMKKGAGVEAVAGGVAALTDKNELIDEPTRIVLPR